MVRSVRTPVVASLGRLVLERSHLRHQGDPELQANSAQDFVVTDNTPTNPNGAVTAYPNAWAHGYGGPVDDYTSLTSTYNVSMPINSSTSAWAMQDDWLTEPGYPLGRDYEVMIQYDFTNNGTCPSTWAQGTQLGRRRQRRDDRRRGLARL